MGVQSFDTFYNNTPIAPDLPIVQVVGSGLASEYTLVGSELRWVGSLDTLEQGQYYTIRLNSQVEDNYEIAVSNKLTGPYLFTPQNDTLIDNFYKFIIKEISTSRRI